MRKVERWLKNTEIDYIIDLEKMIGVINMDKQLSKEKNIVKAIQESGFPLEYEVGTILKKHNWSVINNRYYIKII